MLFGEDTEIQPVDTVLRDFGDEEEREVLIDWFFIKLCVCMCVQYILKT